MEVFALIGSSGTGKSSSALLFAHNNHIPVIIDDGLLIFMGQKIAGMSAKYEKNYITAVKRATFYFEDHRTEVITALKKMPAMKILIIGTSKKMVDLIAAKLGLEKIDNYIDVKEIRSSKEIKMALFVRRTQGKHIIPVPHVQIEQSFFKKLISKGSKVFSLQKELIGETTIVEPNFQKDSIIIYQEVLKKVVAYRCEQIPEIDSYSHIKVSIGRLPCVKVHLGIESSIEQDLIDVIKSIQQDINLDFQQYLNIELFSIDIYVDKLSYI